MCEREKLVGRQVNGREGWQEQTQKIHDFAEDLCCFLHLGGDKAMLYLGILSSSAMSAGCFLIVRLL